MASAKQEHRYIKSVIEAGRSETDRQREIEAATMPRSPRVDIQPPAPTGARRRDVRAWMRQNAHEYESATELAEAANIVFNLPGEGLDDEMHWVWDEAAEAIDEAM